MIGLAIVIGLAGLALAQVRVVVVSLILGLFVAAALQPVVRRLCAWHLPRALAALAGLLLLVVVVAGVFVSLVPLVVAELPQLADQLGQGLRSIDEMLRGEPLGMGIRGLDDLLQTGVEQLSGGGGGGGGAAEEALAAAGTVGGVLVGVVLVLVAGFFYLKDGDRFAHTLLQLVPGRYQEDVRMIGQRTWVTLGEFLRSQLIVAVVDAVLVGVGLLLLGVPLALPLATLVLFGGLFPIVGAMVSGAVAVLVALADGGVTLALAVLTLVIAVQQFEGNVVQPFVVGRVVALHPFVVILSVTVGALTFGVFGAFIAVPVVASASRGVQYLRETHSSPQEEHEPDDHEPEPPAVARAADG